MESPRFVWNPVSSFGYGTIFARGRERRIVTEGFKDLHYFMPLVPLMRSLGKLDAQLYIRPEHGYIKGV